MARSSRQLRNTPATHAERPAGRRAGKDTGREPEKREPDPRRWLALSLLVAAFFMVIVDSQIVMLAMPAIESELGFAPG
ncbi:hypothetical protein ACFVQF_09665, partial [Streptomyces sp. NPDC057866]